MWLESIKAEWYATCPGLIYANVSKYFPVSAEIIKGHIMQSQQGVRSTKLKPPKMPITPQSPLEDRTNESITINNGTPTYELHVINEPISKLYSDDCARFPIKSRSWKKYIMIAYNRDSNNILHTSFRSSSNNHRILAFHSIMERPSQCDHKVKHPFMYKECITKFKRIITEDWKATS